MRDISGYPHEYIPKYDAHTPFLENPIRLEELETRVRETDIHKVERNQGVKVRVQAYPDLKLTGMENIGTYAVQLAWNDGHSSGLFSWETLRALGDESRGPV